MISCESHGLSIHQQLDSLCNSSIRLIGNVSHNWFLVTEIQRWPAAVTDRFPVMQKAFQCHDVISRRDNKRKPNINRWYGTCITELQSRIYISRLGWCKIAIATKWYQFHTTDKCGFLFMPWISDQYTFVRYTKLVNKIGTAVAKVVTFSIMTT